MTVCVWNHWIQPKWVVACWRADLSSVLEDPPATIALLEHLLALGTAHEVLGPAESRIAELHETWRTGRQINTRLTRPPRTTDAAKMSWFDASGSVVDGLVADPGALLRSITPDADAVSSRYMTTGWPPLTISGGRIHYEGDPPRAQRTSSSGLLAFELHSDIWFPFVPDSGHPWRYVSGTPWSSDATPYHFFDNRALASRHTPRLNRFLTEAKAAIIDAGGTWELELESDRMLRPWVGPHGILLDGPVPPLMPEEAYTFDWSTPEELVEERLRASRAYRIEHVIAAADVMKLRQLAHVTIRLLRELPPGGVRRARLKVAPESPFWTYSREQLVAALEGHVRADTGDREVFLRFENGHPGSPIELSAAELA